MKERFYKATAFDAERSSECDAPVLDLDGEHFHQMYRDGFMHAWKHVCYGLLEELSYQFDDSKKMNDQLRLMAAEIVLKQAIPRLMENLYYGEYISERVFEMLYDVD